MRIRTIKPEFYLHEELYRAEKESGLPCRVAYAGLWGAADREGRFKWRPLSLGAVILPFDGVDFSRVLHALTTRGFVVRYRVGDAWYGWIPSFKRHQVINNRERPSELPDVSEAEEVDASTTREAREGHAGKAEGKGREQEGNKEGNGGLGETSVLPASPTASAVAPAAGKKRPGGPVDDATWLAELKASVAYRDLDVERELSKCLIHFKEKGITVSRRRFLNWLNRSERPINGFKPSTNADKRNLGIEAYGQEFSICHEPI